MFCFRDEVLVLTQLVSFFFLLSSSTNVSLNVSLCLSTGVLFFF